MAASALGREALGAAAAARSGNGPGRATRTELTRQATRRRAGQVVLLLDWRDGVEAGGRGPGLETWAWAWGSRRRLDVVAVGLRTRPSLPLPSRLFDADHAEGVQPGAALHKTCQVKGGLVRRQLLLRLLACLLALLPALCLDDSETPLALGVDG